MIVVMKAGATQDEIDGVVSSVEKLGYRAHLIRGVERTVVGCVGDERQDKSVIAETLPSMPGVERVMPILEPYKLASSQFKEEPSEVEVGPHERAGTRDQREAHLLDDVVETVDVPDTGEVVVAACGRVVAPGIDDLDGVETRRRHLLDPVAPELDGRGTEIVERCRPDQLAGPVQLQPVAVEADPHAGDLLPPTAPSRGTRAISRRPGPPCIRCPRP